MDFFSDAGSIPAISTIKRPNALAFGRFPFSLFTLHFSLFTCFPYLRESFWLRLKRPLLRNQLCKLFFQLLFIRTVRE